MDNQQIPKAASHPDVPRPTDAMLLAMASDVCAAIEACGASSELTHAVTLASDLRTYLAKPFPHKYTDMNFGEALEALQRGELVTRAGWNGVGLWLEYRPASGVDLAYIRMSYPVGSRAYPEGARVPWLASQTDMLATDWSIRNHATN